MRQDAAQSNENPCAYFTGRLSSQYLFPYHLVRIVIHHCSSSEKAASKHNYLEADIPVQSVVLSFICPKSTHPFLPEDCNCRAEHALTSDNRTACTTFCDSSHRHTKPISQPNPLHNEKKINKHKNKCQNPNLKKKEKSLNMDQNNAAEDPSLLSCARTLIVS